MATMSNAAVFACLLNPMQFQAIEMPDANLLRQKPQLHA